MMEANHKIALGTAVLAAACFFNLGSAPAQESWGGTGGASTWQAGAPSAAASAPRAAVSGGSSSWVTGKGNVTSGSQSRGEWFDGMGSAPAGSTAGGKGLPGGAVPGPRSRIPAGLNLNSAPALSHLNATTAPGRAVSAGATVHPSVSAGRHGGGSGAGLHVGRPKSTHGRAITTPQHASHGRTQLDFKTNTANIMWIVNLLFLSKLIPELTAWVLFPLKTPGRSWN